MLNGGQNRAVAAGVNAILEKAYERYKNALKENFEDGFKLLMEEVDNLSTREYLRSH
jgi:ribosomal protein S17E